MATIRLNRAATLKASREKGFEVARPLTAKVLAGSKILAPSGTHRHGSGVRVSGPTLKASLHSRQILRDLRQIVFEVGSPLDYAATVHQGSEAHDITGDPLAFFWPRARFFAGNRRRGPAPLFITVKVRHPGNRRPRRFLTTPLVQYGRAAGFLVVTSRTSGRFLP